MPIDMGMEPLEASWVTSGIDRKTYAGFGIMPPLRTTVSVRGTVINPLTGIPSPVSHNLIGDITAVEPGEWKAGERATLAVTMNLIFYQLSHTIPGLPVILVDVINGIRVVDGIDQLIAIRALVGH